jgi:RNA polymerase sigma-70 factor (ECF subfamily)
MWKSIPAFREQAKPTTFLYRVCHNAALLWCRREKTHRRRVEQFEGFAADHPSRESEAMVEERLKALYCLIRQLAPLDRSLIRLLLDGMSYRDMAAILALSESNVGVKLNRIKNNLVKTG